MQATLPHGSPQHTMCSAAIIGILHIIILESSHVFYSYPRLHVTYTTPPYSTSLNYLVVESKLQSKLKFRYQCCVFSGAADNNAMKTSSSTLELHSRMYCGWPYVASIHHNVSMTECIIHCIHQQQCHYVNVKKQTQDACAQTNGSGDACAVTDIYTCHVTSFLAGENDVTAEVGDPWQWRSYLVRKWPSL